MPARRRSSTCPRHSTNPSGWPRARTCRPRCRFSAPPSARCRTARRTGGRRPPRRSIPSTSRRQACSSRRNPGGSAVNVIQPVFDGGQRRAAKSLRDVSVQQSKLAMTDLEIRARSEVRLAQEQIRSLQRRSADGASGGGAVERGAAHHDLGLRGRRDDEHRGHRRAASGPRCRDGHRARRRRRPSRATQLARRARPVPEIAPPTRSPRRPRRTRSSLFF